MFMRRGCLLGCGGWIIACVAIALLGWFVAIPRISDVLENSLADDLSTIIADEINPLYSRNQLQQGTDVQFSFGTLNREFEQSTDDSIDAFRITSSGDRIIIELEVSGQTFDVEFIPGASSDGRFELKAVDDGGWWQRQFTNVIAGGFEQAVNQWLDQNDLRVTGVSLDGTTLVLSVTGK